MGMFFVPRALRNQRAKIPLLCAAFYAVSLLLSWATALRAVQTAGAVLSLAVLALGTGLAPGSVLTAMAKLSHAIKGSGAFAPPSRRLFNYHVVRPGLVVGRQPRSMRDVDELLRVHPRLYAVLTINEPWELFLPVLPSGSSGGGSDRRRADDDAAPTGAVARRSTKTKTDGGGGGRGVDVWGNREGATRETGAAAGDPSGDPWALRGIERMHLNVPDFQAPSRAQIQQAVKFIDDCVLRGGTVYVHCNGGKGRSATVAACYLLKHEGAWCGGGVGGGGDGGEHGKSGISEGEGSGSGSRSGGGSRSGWSASRIVGRVVADLKRARPCVSPGLVDYPFTSQSRAIRDYVRFLVSEDRRHFSQ